MNLQTVRTVCRELNIPENRLRYAIRAGRLAVLELGNRQLVDMDAARDLLAPTDANLVGIDDLRKATGLSESGIRRGVREGWIPCSKVGKALMFDLDEVEKAITARMKPRT